MLVGSDLLVLFRLVLEFRQFVIKLYYWGTKVLATGKNASNQLLSLYRGLRRLAIKNCDLMKRIDCRFVVVVLLAQTLLLYKSLFTLITLLSHHQNGAGVGHCAKKKFYGYA